MERILNVNDDEAGRYTVSRLLTQHGFEVLEAGTGKEGLELARTRAPSLVILDIKLPDMSGYEVCRALKGEPETCNLPVLHLTANALSVESKVRSINEGADAYLTFPLEPSFLLATIHSLLRLKKAEQEREVLFTREKAEREKLARALEEL